MTIEIIFWLLLIDSFVAVCISLFGNKEYFNRIFFFKRYFPLTNGWTIFYLILVLFIGYLVYFY